MKLHPSWWDTADRPAIEAGPPPARVDVAVIGGGITGLCAARAAARRGARVAVFEAETLGWGASTRNGGMVLTGLKLGAGTLIARYGAEAARRYFRASLEAIHCVEQLVSGEGIDCQFVRCGHLALASKPGHVRRFGETAALLSQELGHPVRLLSAADLAGEIGSDHYHGGLLDPASASIHPARYVAGLVRAALTAGATLHEGSCVLQLTRTGSGWRLRLATAEVEAAEVLVATSGYTGPATPALRRRIVPIGSYIIATEPLTGEQARALIPRGRMLYDSRHFLHYFRLTPDGRLLFGGRARFVPETGSSVRQSAQLLRRGMLQTFPQLHDLRVDYAWGGTLDFAFDTMPHAGRQDACHYALGYAGHGVALATYLGSCIGKSLGGDLRDLPFADLPLPGPPLGLYWGRPWFLPLVAARYRLLDRLS